MSEDIKPVIWMDASGNTMFDVQSSSGNVPLTFFSDPNSETITRDTFVVEEEVATDKPLVTRNEKDNTYKIVALFSPKNQIVKQPMNPQPHYILTPSAQNQVQLNQSLAKFQVITPSKNLEHPSPWLHPNIRKRSLDIRDGYIPESRRRKTNHSGKGLRHFSMKVCEKVKTKQITTYNEVADELVSELYVGSDSQQSRTDHSFDQKNIRRRVYDALNVLMAMNIISKEKKEIKWIGLPTSTNQEYQLLEVEADQISKRLQSKRQHLCELILQQIAFKNLLERNQKAEMEKVAPAPQAAIQLPFILVSTSKRTIIDCNISNDRCDFVFKFDRVFSIHDDIEILKSMGLCPNFLKQRCTEQEIARILKHLPVALHSFIKEMARHPSLAIKTEPESSLFTGTYSSAADESLDDTAWTGLHALSRHSSSVASRSDQPSPNYTNDSEDSE